MNGDEYYHADRVSDRIVILYSVLVLRCFDTKAGNKPLGNVARFYDVIGIRST